MLVSWRRLRDRGCSGFFAVVQKQSRLWLMVLNRHVGYWRRVQTRSVSAIVSILTSQRVFLFYSLLQVSRDHSRFRFSLFPRSCTNCLHLSEVLLTAAPVTDLFAKCNLNSTLTLRYIISDLSSDTFNSFRGHLQHSHPPFPAASTIAAPSSKLSLSFIAWLIALYKCFTDWLTDLYYTGLQLSVD